MSWDDKDGGLRLGKDRDRMAQSGKLKIHNLIFELLFSDSSLASINNYKITLDIFRLDIIHGVKK